MTDHFFPMLAGGSDFPDPTGEQLFTWLKCLVAVAGIYYLFLLIVKAHRRHPPLDEELEKKISKIGKEASITIEAVRTTMMPREEAKTEIARLDAYTHDMRHEMRTELQAISLKVDGNSVTMREGMENMRSELEARRSQGVAGLHQLVRDTQTDLASVKKEAEIHTAQIAQIDVKIDRMPEKIIGLLQARTKS
jgi:signal transduction histidine kinase